MTIGLLNAPASHYNMPLPSKQFLEIEENEHVAQQEKQARYLRDLSAQITEKRNRKEYDARKDHLKERLFEVNF